jgi:hypothetical protein
VNLLSHGKNSSLLEHTKEVCLAAENLEERIICSCHDVGKATVAWQQYAKNEFKDKSPHLHAVAGGLLASLLIKLLNKPNSKIWSIVALHAAGGHHSYIGILSTDNSAVQRIANDDQAKSFFLEEITLLLPEIPRKLFVNAWNCFKTISPMSRLALKDYNLWISSCTGKEKNQIFILSRSLLGRLCYQDYQSAAKQSENTESVQDWRQTYPDKEFIVRKPKIFCDNEKDINKLRFNLKKEFHSVVRQDSFFYFIDATILRCNINIYNTLICGHMDLYKKHLSISCHRFNEINIILFLIQIIKELLINILIMVKK